MPVGSIALIMLAALAMLFAAGCHGLNQYHGGDDRFGVYSVPNSLPPSQSALGSSSDLGSRSSRGESSAVSDDEGASADLDDAPPVVKYLPQDYSEGPAEELADDGKDESSSHLADNRRKRRP